jgi:hypothetical protein
MNYIYRFIRHIRISPQHVLLIIQLCTIWSSCESFKWHLADNLEPDKVLTFSERYMFGNNVGPEIMEKGPSYIVIDTNVHA